MQKLFGILFVAAGIAAGLKGWQVWREMGDHSVNVLVVVILGSLSFFFLWIGVQFMRGLNPAREFLRFVIGRY